MIKIDKAGDYYYRGPYDMYHWVIVDRTYYPLVGEERDDNTYIEFDGLNVQSQKIIFALCVEGWV